MKKALKKSKKLKIGYKEYDLISTKDPRCEGESVNGSINFRTEKIAIKSNLKGSTRAQVLFHEVVHAIDDYLVIGLNEDKTDKIAKGFTLFLTENKELVKEILQLEEEK